MALLPGGRVETTSPSLWTSLVRSAAKSASWMCTCSHTPAFAASHGQNHDGTYRYLPTFLTRANLHDGRILHVSFDGAGMLVFTACLVEPSGQCLHDQAAATLLIKVGRCDITIMPPKYARLQTLPNPIPRSAWKLTQSEIATTPTITTMVR